MARLTKEQKQMVDNREWLYKHYIAKNMRVQEIANIFNVHKCTIERLLKKYNIKKDAKTASILKKQTNLEKYGVEAPTQSRKLKEKAKQTNLRKYGKEHWMQLEEKIQQRSETNKKKYGCSHVMQNSKIKEKTKQTNLKKYGHVNPLWSESIRKKVIETNMEKYGHVNPMENRKIAQKLQNTFIERYNVTNPLKMDSVKNKGKQTRARNGNLMHVQGVDVSALAKKYNASEDFVRKNIRAGKNIVELLENFQQYNQNSLEQKISKSLNIPFHNKMVCTKSVRYKPDFKLTDKDYLNVDGLYWHSEAVKKDKNYHFNMRKAYEEQGLRVLQFREDELNNKPHILYSMINNLLNKNDKVYARNTEVKDVQQKEANDFLNQNHIMGNVKAKHVGLYGNDELVMLISYKQYKKDSILKIERMCSKVNTSVVGGFSKLLKYMEENVNPKQIDYWVDLRYGTGDFLLNHNFSHSHDTLGWKWTNFIDTYNRQKIKAKMDNRNLSERQHANELGFVKIYDAGQRLYKRFYV